MGCYHGQAIGDCVACELLETGGIAPESPVLAKVVALLEDRDTLRTELAELQAGGDSNLHLDLVCGAAAKDGALVMAKGGCGVAFGTELTYRCTDCNTVFHRECARKHFGEHP